MRKRCRKGAVLLNASGAGTVTEVAEFPYADAPESSAPTVELKEDERGGLKTITVIEKLSSPPRPPNRGLLVSEV